MTNSAVMGGLLVLAIGGGAGAWFLLQGGEVAGLDATGAELLRLVEEEQARPVADRDACRKLLSRIERHPGRGVHRGLIRAEAWLYLRVGNSNRAWDALRPGLDVDAAPADLGLGLQILKTRHAETGLDDPAEQGMVFAEDHYRATRSVSSAFVGWQLAVRLGREAKMKRFLEMLAEHPQSLENRVAVALDGFPGVKELAATDADFARYRSLLDEFDGSPPEELSLAVAWCEIQKVEDRIAGMKRAEAVMQSFRSSVTARTLVATAAVLLEQWDRAMVQLDDLLKRFPGHPKARVWTQLRLAAVAGADKEKKR